MDFRIADTLTGSLARLTAEEQKAVKTTVFDLQVDPSSPGMQFHKVERARDPNFWSVRVTSDLRLIVHRTASSLLLCYVDHHDDAYRWAMRRRLETQPHTGAAQIVEIRETVQEILVPTYVEDPHPRPVPARSPSRRRLFEHLPEEELLGFGVPVEWIGDVRQADEDTLLVLADHLPAEAAEALLELATGGRPAPAPRATVGADPFQHPDALRRFRVMTNVEELRQALDSPWEKWVVFLHPAQRGWVEREYSGPARVSGSAGTGKTVVALHRAAHLARRHSDARVLLATFSDPLANALRAKMRCLLGSEPKLGETLEVHSLPAIGRRLYELQFGPAQLAPPETLRALLAEAAGEVEGHRFSAPFLWSEWDEVVDAWQLGTWEAYRDVRRLGRKTRLPEAQRAVLWSIFDRVRSRLEAGGMITSAGMFARLAARLTERRRAPFEFAVIDESQDLTVSQLRFLAALGTSRPDSLFFAGDLGQRIFQQPFSWKSLGVDVRGRSRTLHINYRTSHQIRMQADRLLGPSVSDVDGNTEDRRGTVSVFNGPFPAIRILDGAEAEEEVVAAWLREWASDGLAPHEIGVFVRSEAELDRARDAVRAAGLPLQVLDDRAETMTGHAAVSTMHLAKGLEFRAVVVMACDDEVLPLQSRIEGAADEVELEEVYNTERHLLYVACTRARDHLLVTGTKPASEFLDDLKG